MLKRFPVKIVDNTPPIAVLAHEYPVLSYTSFNVYCDSSLPDSDREKSNDFIETCFAFLRKDGIVIDSKSTIARNRKIQPLKLTPESVGKYTIEITVEDSHGLSSTTNKAIDILKGKTGKDIPVVFVRDEKIECSVGKVCVIDASKSKELDKEIYVFRIYIKREGEIIKQMTNSSGVFLITFERPGNYKVNIEASYYNQVTGFKSLEVTISNPGEDALLTQTTSTPAPPQTQKPTSKIALNKEGLYKTAIAVLVATLIVLYLVYIIVKRSRDK